MDSVKNLTATSITNAAGTSGTTINVTTGTGAYFPAPPFDVVIWATGTLPTFANAEIARCTAYTTDTLTVTRSVDGTAQNVTATGWQVAQSIDATLLRQLQTYSGSLASGTRAITVPSTTAYQVISGTGGVFTANSSGASTAAFPASPMLLIGNSSDTQITISPMIQPPMPAGGWTSSTLPVSQVWSSLATNGAGNWVAISSAAGTAAAYSTNNGTTWSASTLATSGTYYGIAYGNNVYITVASGATTTQIFNGTSWSNGGALPATNSWRAVAYGNVGGTTPTFVASCQTASGQPAYTTNNGTTWTACTGVGANTAGIAYGNGKFMTVAGNGGGSWTSTNGQSFTSQGTIPGGTITWSGLAYGNGRWVTVSTTFLAAVSTNDGASWTTVRLPGNTGSIVFAGGVFFAVGSSTFYWSVDGLVWQTGAGGSFSTSGYGVGYGNGYFVAVQNISSATGAYFQSTNIYPVNYAITPTSYNATS